MQRDPKMYPSSIASAVNLQSCVTLGLNTQPVFHEGCYLSEKKENKAVWHTAPSCLSHDDCAWPTYHEVAPENQGNDLGLGRGVAVVIAGEVAPLPPAVGQPVLPVVFGAEHLVQAEEQQDQDDARGQAQRSHPVGRERYTENKVSSRSHQQFVGSV